LNQGACKDCRSCPPTSTRGHFPEPCLEGQSASVHNLIHRSGFKTAASRYVVSRVVCSK
jgi:hypothetical protein